MFYNGGELFIGVLQGLGRAIEALSNFVLLRSPTVPSRLELCPSAKPNCVPLVLGGTVDAMALWSLTGHSLYGHA